MRTVAILLLVAVLLGAGLFLPNAAPIVPPSGWIEITEMRSPTSKSYINLSNPSQRSFHGGMATIHYESIPDSGVYDAEVNFKPRRVNNARLDGWTVTQAGWHYALGQPGDKSTDGWVGFGGRQGDHWVKFRLARVGYLHWPTRTWDDLGGPPTYDRASLASVTSSSEYGHGNLVNVQTTATWSNIWTTPGGGSLNISWRANADGLKEDIIINQAAREWLATNRPPSTPAADTWFGFALEVDWSDVPKIFRAGLELNPNDDFVDDGQGIELRDALDRFLAFMPIGDVRVPSSDPLTPDDVQPLRKRFWLDGGGNHYVLVGIRLPELAGMQAGNLVFDPTTIDEQVGTGTDDGYSKDSVQWYNWQTYMVVGNYPGDIPDVDAFSRFTTVNIPQGETVASAYIEVMGTGANPGGSGTRSNLHFNDADDAAAPTSMADHISKVRTTAFTAWDDNTLTADVWEQSPDITDVIQEILDRPSWVANNDMMLLWDDDASNVGMLYEVYAYESGDGTKAIKLHIVYGVWSNSAPTITNKITSDSGEVSAAYSRQFDATDADSNQTLVWTLVSDAAFLSIDSLNRTTYVNGTPTAAASFYVNATVSDSIATDFTNYTLTISAVDGRGGPAAPKILLTTSTAYFGWNTVILNADAIVEKSGGPDPDEVLFYRWDMGDGTIRTGPEVTHSYSLRWFWSVYDVTLDVCTMQESVCETRTIPIFLVFWPAVYGLIFVTLAILILLARKVRWRVVTP